MTVKQVYTIINAAAAQATGTTANAAHDLTGLIALGDTVLSTDTTKDAFYQALPDVIGKAVVSNKKYTAKEKALVKNLFEWGVALEKIYVAPTAAVENQAYDIPNGSNVNDMGVVAKNEVKVKIFANRDVWEFNYTIMDYQIKSAFHNETEMAAFIAGIYNAMESAIELALENLVNACIENFICEKIHAQTLVEDNTKLHAVNLLHEYNEETNQGLTVASCQKDVDFLKYCAKRFINDKRLFAKMTTCFNVDGFYRFTPAEDVGLYVLASFADAQAFYLQADTYHKELVAMPNYDVVEYWHGVGDRSFSDLSKVAATTSSGNAVEQSGVIALLFDPEAMGVLNERTTSKTFNNPKKDFTHYWQRFERGFYNDLSENGIVYYIAEA